jgi:hypothetical protein
MRRVKKIREGQYRMDEKAFIPYVFFLSIYTSLLLVNM